MTAGANRLRARAPIAASWSAAVGARSVRRAALVVAGLVASAAGCGGEAPGAARNDEPTATTQSKLSLGIGVWSWGTTDGTELDVGPWSSQTCFLAGIAGDLNSGSWVERTDSQGHPDMANSFAGVRKWYDRYQVRAWGGMDSKFVPTYNAVNTKVVCIGTAMKTEFPAAWEWGQPAQPLVPVGPNVQCFLQNVYGLNGTWTSDNYIYIWNDGLMWYIKGTLKPDANGNTGWAGAVCVDLPDGTQLTPFGASAPNPGSSLGAPAASGNWMACGLQGIFGTLDTSSWTDGAMLNWPPGLTGWWTVDTWNGKAAWGNCLQ
jgi:hypothetical protein